MTKSISAGVGIMIALAGAPCAMAQVTLDVAKITCDQFVGYKITNPHNIAIWLSGFDHGKQNSTVMDTQTLEANARKLQDYCLMNPQYR